MGKGELILKKLILLIIIVALIYQFGTKDPPHEVNITDNEQSSDTLLLINRDTPILQEPTNLIQIPANLADNVKIDSKFWIQAQLLKPLQQLFEAAQTDEIHHFQINSAYRSSTLQQQLYEKNGADLALPAGYSEHQSGLAIDIGSTQGKMDDTDEGNWLAQHASEYGFVLRYPENKVDITGISFEPWHFRYVGLPHSLIMQQDDLVLEEYLDILKQQKKIKKSINGNIYRIQFVEQLDPNVDYYDVSATNAGGYIITTQIK